MHRVSVLLPWQRTCEKQSMREKSLSVIHGFQGCSPLWAGCMAFMPAAKQEHHSRRAGQAMRMCQDQGVTFKVSSPGTCFASTFQGPTFQGPTFQGPFSYELMKLRLSRSEHPNTTALRSVSSIHKSFKEHFFKCAPWFLNSRGLLCSFCLVSLGHRTHSFRFLLSKMHCDLCYGSTNERLW